MLSSFALIALLNLSGPMQDDAPQCDITVYFGSYATGIDRASEARIKGYLESHPALTFEIVGPRGREGEYTLCVRASDPAKVSEALLTLKSLVTKSERGGPVDIRRAGQAAPGRL